MNLIRPTQSDPAVLRRSCSGRGYFTISGVTFVLAWSSGAIVTPFGLAAVSPQAFLTIRACGCAVFAWAIWAVLRDQLPRTSSVWMRMLGVGLLMQVAYQGCFFVALDRGISPGLLALIVSAQPLLTAFATHTRTGRIWMALILGASGVALAVAADLPAATNTVGGVIAALGALAAITTGTMMQSRSASAAGMWAALAVQSTLSASVFGLILVLVGVGRLSITPTFVASAAWMICVVSIGATALLYAMVRRRNNVAVTGLFFSVPGVTAILDFVIHRTPMAIGAVVGFAMTVGALFMIGRTPEPAPHHTDDA